MHSDHFSLEELVMNNILGRKEIETYKGYLILQYEDENGYRVDFGTKRTKLVETIEAARQLVDFRFSPDKWDK